MTQNSRQEALTAAGNDSDLHEAVCRCINDQSNIGILTTDTQLTILSWNRWLVLHSGIPAEKMIGRKLLEEYPDLPKRHLDRYYQEALAGQNVMLSQRFHNYLLPLPPTVPGRTPRPMPFMLQSVRISPLIDDEVVIGTLTLIEDVSERTLRSWELESHIAKLSRSEEALQASSDRLAKKLLELERRNREITLLGEMGNLLLLSRDFTEGCDIISRFLRQLFPEDAGLLFFFNPVHNRTEPAVSWGDPPLPGRDFKSDDCWALRRGQMYVVENPDRPMRCWKQSEYLPKSYMCIPLKEQDAVIGVLQITNWRDGKGFPLEQRQLAQTVAENIALGLSNLRLRETLKEQTIRDPLTGLFNRRYLAEAMARELSRAERAGRNLGVIMLDIDHFKDFNDQHGHQAGDTLLRELAAFLNAAVRPEDIACRYGGEEFTLILPDAPAEAVRQRAEEIREKVKKIEVGHMGNHLGQVTLSLGVAIFPYHGASTEELIRSADHALYRAKAGGRDRVETAEAA